MKKERIFWMVFVIIAICATLVWAATFTSYDDDTTVEDTDEFLIYDSGEGSGDELSNITYATLLSELQQDLKPVTTGTFSTPITTNPYTLTAANATNAILFYGATGEIDFPALADGMNVIVYNTGAFTITIDPNGTEVIVREGTAQAGGVSMTLSSGAGNYVALVSDGEKWITLGSKGTLAVGS